jgi:HlyD family secretion protein
LGEIVVHPGLLALMEVGDAPVRLQVWAAVNEAYIPQIRQQQPVRFTVAAWPSKVFDGKVKQIRPNATMTQNVVT